MLFPVEESEIERLVVLAPNILLLLRTQYLNTVLYKELEVRFELSIDDKIMNIFVRQEKLKSHCSIAIPEVQVLSKSILVILQFSNPDC
jgi:hypothetical protein